MLNRTVVRFGTGHPDPMRVKTGLEMEARLHEALRDLARRGAGAPAPSLSGAFGWRGRLGLTPKMP